MEQEILKPVKPLKGKHKAIVVQFDTQTGECIRIDYFKDMQRANAFHNSAKDRSGRIARLITCS